MTIHNELIRIIEEAARRAKNTAAPSNLSGAGRFAILGPEVDRTTDNGDGTTSHTALTELDVTNDTESLTGTG